MIKTMIYLRTRQHRRLKTLATWRKLSMAALIRLAVDYYLESEHGKR